MTPEQWKKLDALFHEALELAKEARAAHLAKVCGVDGQLREEAERLIAAHEREGDFIDSPIFAETTAPTADDLNQSPVGRRIGPYRVIRLLGRGGKDQAFEWLEKAYQERSYYLAYLKVSPAADPLRADPRFDGLLRRIGAPR